MCNKMNIASLAASALLFSLSLNALSQAVEATFADRDANQLVILIGASPERPRLEAPAEPIDVTPRPGEEIDPEATLSGNQGGIGSLEPRPFPVSWTRISSGATHHILLPSSGLMVVNMETASDETPLQLMLFDANWTLLAQHSSLGCGAYIIEKPQNFHLIIMNPGASNEYLLHLMDFGWLK